MGFKAVYITWTCFCDDYNTITPCFTIRAATWENQQSAYAKTKTQSSFAVTSNLISAFVFATRIVPFFFYLLLYIQYFKRLACSCDCTCWFISDLVGNPNFGFSHATAHIKWGVRVAIFHGHAVMMVCYSFCKHRPPNTDMMGDSKTDPPNTSLCIDHPVLCGSILPNLKCH